MMTRVLAILSCLTLVACASLDASRDPYSPYFVVPVGSVIELHQALGIEPGSARIWLQGGHAARGRDWYEPACTLEIRRIDHDTVQTVMPGNFSVRRVQMIEEMVQEDPPLQLAAVGPLGGLHFSDRDGGPMGMWLGYHLWLENADQPDVMRMTCTGAFARVWQATSPSLEDLRVTFGDIASLRLP